jgi:potassium-transporting ATPase potassium-binding subunit
VTLAGWLELVVLIAAIAISTPLLGGYMARVYDPTLGRPPGDRVFAAIERPIFRVCRIDPEREQRWNLYALSLLAFSLVSLLVLYAQLRLQGHLFLNPDHYKGVDPKLSFNTAVSFLTNTNWQAYGDGVMSHLTQMAGLAFHNFVSAAAGAAVAVALIRGLVRRRTRTLGNFWVDLVRTCVRVLVPLAFVAAIVLMSQGVIDNFHASRTVTTVTGAAQTIPGGPVASQEAIKEGGQNGGGFFGANSATPFENPNGITNLLEMWLILGIPFAFAYTFGKMARDMKQGWVVFATMFVLWLVMLLIVTPLEARGSPKLTAAGADQHTTALQAGGNMEGKETRFGPVTCGYFAASTTSTSDGAVNCQHDSLTPLGGGTVLVNMMYGEISPGGTGSGLFGMLIFALLAVFIAGLMVGRTPEYLGKKIQGPEMKLVALYLLMPAIFILGFAGAAVVIHTALNSRLNSGPHGLTEIVYAYTEAFNNNGSAFGGLAANTQWYDTTLGIVMLVGRLGTMIPVLAIGGSVGRKKVVPATAGTFPTGTPLFAFLLIGVIIVVVGLTYFPVVALGPVVEHLVGHF